MMIALDIFIVALIVTFIVLSLFRLKARRNILNEIEQLRIEIKQDTSSFAEGVEGLASLVEQNSEKEETPDFALRTCKSGVYNFVTAKTWTTDCWESQPIVEILKRDIQSKSSIREVYSWLTQVNEADKRDASPYDEWAIA